MRDSGRQGMAINSENKDWSTLTYEEKNRQLFNQQKKTLDLFLERRAISQEQHDKSLHDLTEKIVRRTKR